MKPPFVIDVPEPRYFRDDHCANCLEPLPDEIQVLYCSTWCQEVAAHVRYVRGAQRDGRIHDPDVQLAIRTKNAFLLIGGYRPLGRKLTPRIREDVKQRDGGLCQQCGKPGAEVDHIDGNSDQLDNLQLLCLDCHHAKTEENLVPAADEERALLLAFMATRVAPDEPQLLADDSGWKDLWRSLQAARKERFMARLSEAGVRVRSKDSHAAKVAALRAAIAAPEGPEGAPYDFGRDVFFDDVMGRNS